MWSRSRSEPPVKDANSDEKASPRRTQMNCFALEHSRVKLITLRNCGLHYAASAPTLQGAPRNRQTAPARRRNPASWEHGEHDALGAHLTIEIFDIGDSETQFDLSCWILIGSRVQGEHLIRGRKRFYRLPDIEIAHDQTCVDCDMR